MPVLRIIVGDVLRAPGGGVDRAEDKHHGKIMVSKISTTFQIEPGVSVWFFSQWRVVSLPTLVLERIDYGMLCSLAI